MAEKRYFWLKLHKDFFKRHDIRVIEDMPNGKDYILFYLKLLCESTSHEGNLRFSDEIPYNESMLATITNTNVDIVKSAIKVFTSLHMMEVLDDGTVYMTAVERMIGSETDYARKKRAYREGKRLETMSSPCLDVSHECPTEIEKEIESESDSDIDNYSQGQTDLPSRANGKRFVPPTVEEIRDYCMERGNTIDAENFHDFYASKGWMVGKSKMKDWKACVRTWERNAKKDNKPVIDIWAC